MTDGIRTKNFDQVCRLCLEYASDTNTLYPLFINEAKVPGFYGRFLKEFKESIPEVISACIGIEIDPTAKLPLNICSACEEQLIASNQFRQKCLQSNEYLLKFPRNCEDDDNFDTDDLPLDSWKYPELIIVDRLKDEFKQEDMEMDSSCDSTWNNYDDDNSKHETTRKEKSSIDDKPLTKTECETVVQQKAAVKRSTTMTLNPMPIVSINCSQVLDCNESQSHLNPPKRQRKNKYPKKPKMCTVCGIIVDRLRDHMRTHPDALEYCCTLCPRKYLTKKGLVKHMKHKHNEDSILRDPTNAQLRTLEVLKKYRGESYMSRDGGFRRGKCIGPACKQCFYKCSNNIPTEQRELLFNNFYDLGNIRKQWEYIAKCIVRTETKYCHIVEKPNRKRRERNLNIAYHFQLDDSRIRVCKTFLMNTLGISNTVIKTALKKCNENGELIVGDKRGKLNRKLCSREACKNDFMSTK